MNVSPTAVYPEVSPWMLVWPEFDWDLLKTERKEQGKIDQVTVFRRHVMTKYRDFTHTA